MKMIHKEEDSNIKMNDDLAQTTKKPCKVNHKRKLIFQIIDSNKH